MPGKDETTFDTIIHLKRREPFAPFRIVMTSGDRYSIEDPDALAIGGSQLFYYLPGTGRLIHMRLNQIAVVEEENEKPAA